MSAPDPTKQREYSRAHYQQNKEKIDRRTAAFNRANPERRRQISRESARRRRAQRTPEQIEIDRASARERGAARYAKDPEPLREYARRWRRENPERHNSNTAAWRALVAGAAVESVDREIVFLRDKGMCALCGVRVDHRRWDLDHILPLSRGGAHSYENVQVSHPACNRRKGNRIEVIPDEQQGQEGMGA